MEQHDDQHAAVGVVEQSGVDDRPFNGKQESIDPDIHPGDYERRVPQGPQHPQDQAGKECRAPDLQPWQSVAPEARLLPSASEAGDQEPEEECRDKARSATQFCRRGGRLGTEQEDVERRSGKGDHNEK